MVDVAKLESNLYDSFNRVKSDILRLNAEINKLNSAAKSIVEAQSKQNERIDAIYAKLAAVAQYATRPVQKPVQQPVKTVVVERVKVKQAKHKSAKFVASKTGKKFHVPNCIFAKNIKPKMRIVMHSKDAMLNKGYKPCECAQK